jgi:hypothetical protein
MFLRYLYYKQQRILKRRRRGSIWRVPNWMSPGHLDRESRLVATQNGGVHYYYKEEIVDIHERAVLASCKAIF